MKFSYRDSYDISAPAEPGRAKTVICPPPRSTLCNTTHTTAGCHNGSMTPEAAATSENGRDPYLWLEEIPGAEALDWVRARNEPALAEFRDAEFERMRIEALEVLDTDARIPYVVRRGEYLYNFWRDAANPRGLWRRTTLDSYRTDSPEWDVLIDVDELGRTDDEKGVWAGGTAMEPGFRRALIGLSRGGSDASIVREFDML